MSTLPETAFEAVQAVVPEGRTFEGLLQNVILSLSLDLESLLPGLKDLERFQSLCFKEGEMLSEYREKVMFLLDRQLASNVEDEENEDQIVSEVKEEIHRLEQASEDGMMGMFLIEE